MTKHKAKISAAVFSVKSAPKMPGEISIEKPEGEFASGGKSDEIDAEKRFARLRKSLRKKSVSIL